MEMKSLFSHVLTAVITAVVISSIGYIFIYAPSDIAVLKSEMSNVKENQSALKFELSILDQRLHGLLISLASQHGINVKAITMKNSLRGFSLKEKRKLVIDLMQLDNIKDRKKYLISKGFSKAQINDILMKK